MRRQILAFGFLLLLFASAMSSVEVQAGVFGLLITTDLPVYGLGDSVTITVSVTMEAGVVLYVMEPFSGQKSTLASDYFLGARSYTYSIGDFPGAVGTYTLEAKASSQVAGEEWYTTSFTVEAGGGQPPAQPQSKPYITVNPDYLQYAVGDTVTIFVVVRDIVGTVNVEVVVEKPTGGTVPLFIPSLAESQTGSVTLVVTDVGNYKARATIDYNGFTYTDWTSFEVIAGSSNNGGGGTTFDFTLAVSPSYQTVMQSKTAVFQVLLTYSDPSYSGTTISIQITGLGSGMNYQLATSGTLSISTSTSTPTGTYNIGIIGSALGVTHQTTATLVVTTLAAASQTATATFDFAVEASPTSQTLKAGQSTTYAVNVRLVSGTGQPVTLSLLGLPGDVTYTFSPASGTATFSSSLKIATTSSTALGTYSLTMVADGGGVTRTMIIELVIEKTKSASSVTVSVNPTMVNMGETVAVTGIITPGVQATVDIIYRNPDGFELTRHVSSSSTGSFSDSFTPDMDGAWSVKARLMGNEEIDASESSPTSFTVQTAPQSASSVWEQIPGGQTTLIAILIIALIAAIGATLSRRGRRPPPPPPIATKRCVKCGTELPVTSVYCSNCGERT